jgi:antitoxin HicB
MKKTQLTISLGLDKVIYYAHIVKQDDSYLVEFPELPGCLTEGSTLEEAKMNAREALSGWLFVAIKNGDDFHPPKIYRGKNYFPVTPDLDVAIPLLIFWARKIRGLTQAQVAKEIGVSQQAYRKLEIPGKSNPTLRTVSKLINVLNLPPCLISSSGVLN